MRIPSGSTDRYLFFVARDSATLLHKTGLTAFTVYLTRDAQNTVPHVSPVIEEIDSTNAAGIYRYRLNKETTVTSGHYCEQLHIRITAAGMESVDQAVDLTVVAQDRSFPMPETHVMGASGYALIHTVLDVDGITPLNISSYSGTKQIGFTSKDSGETLVTAAFLSDGTDGKLTYTVAAGFWDTPGLWKRSAKVQDGGSAIYRDVPLTFVVVEFVK